MKLMMDGVFWNGDMGFVVDPQQMQSSFPDARTMEPREFGDVLLSSKKLPAIDQAPVASWLLARLFQLTRERLGFETDTRIGNDGGGFYLNFIAFTRELRTAAFFNLHGDFAGVRIWGTCAAEFDPETIVQTFLEVLLANPNDLMVCKLTTIDTDPLNLHKGRVGKPLVYGWDGRQFLGVRKS